MKCYFDENLEAQGQCTRCGRFASRAYSRILDGKFVCVECAFGGTTGVLDWIRRFQRFIDPTLWCGKIVS